MMADNYIHNIIKNIYTIITDEAPLVKLINVYMVMFVVVFNTNRKNEISQ